MTEYLNYKKAMVSRFWDYQKRHFPQIDGIFERPFATDGRPPVFLPGEAARNVMVHPDLGPAGADKLLALVPKWERHRWFGSMSSSQALAQSVLGNLAVGNQLHCLTDLQADEGDSLLGNAQVSSTNFAMEHKVSHLEERRPTSLDGYISGSYRVAIECKLMEAEMGPCSRSRLTPTNPDIASGHCSGNYTVQHGRLVRCPLTQDGVMYWHYVPKLFGWGNDIDLTPCPLNENYQLVRNILAVCTDANGTVAPISGHAVLIYDARNPAFRDGGKGLAAYRNTRAALIEPAVLRKCSWQRLVSRLREQGILPWLTEQLKLKYGL